MTLLLAILVGVLFGAGVYLVLKRNLVRVIFGLILISNAVNLTIFLSGRVGRLAPPIAELGALAPDGTLLETVANPLPQALVLTAIVIGFGLIAFTLVLGYRSYATLGSVDTEAIEASAEHDAALAAAAAGVLPGDSAPPADSVQVVPRA
jgi:multicomponent Na+:H+ antiporter subunit C